MNNWQAESQPIIFRLWRLLPSLDRWTFTVYVSYASYVGTLTKSWQVGLNLELTSNSSTFIKGKHFEISDQRHFLKCPYIAVMILINETLILTIVYFTSSIISESQKANSQTGSRKSSAFSQLSKHLITYGKCQIYWKEIELQTCSSACFSKRQQN